MTKFLTLLATGLLFPLSVGILVYVFQDRVKGLVGVRPVDVSVYQAPFHDYKTPRPSDDAPPRPFPKPKSLRQISANLKAIADWSADRARDSHVRGDNFAKIHVENNTSKSISNVLLDTRKVGDFDAVIVANEKGGKDSLTQNTGLLRIPDLGPGDARDVYVWSTYDLFGEYNVTRLKIHTSEGGFRLRVMHYASDEYEQGWWGFFDRNFAWFVCALLLLMLLSVGIAAAILSTYLTQIMSDEGNYQAERARFMADPKKFSLKLKNQSGSP